MWDLGSKRKFPPKIVFSTHVWIFFACLVSIFGEGACSPSCLSEANQSQNEEQLPRPRLKLWRYKEAAIPAILDHPGDKINEFHAIQASNKVSQVYVLDVVSCTAPFPVLLVALTTNDSEEEFKMSSMIFPFYEAFHFYPLSKPWNNYPTTPAQTNRSDVFETQTHLPLRTDRRVSVFACEAVHNPCLTSAGKLVFTNLGESRQPGPFPSFNFTVTMTQNLQPHHHPFLTSVYNSLPKINSCSSDNCTGTGDGNSSLNGTKMESDCDAIFYYQTVETRPSMTDEMKHELAYSCEFPDGSPGFVKVNRCTNRGRCNFPQKRKQMKQNCWRQLLPGTTCKNCTKMTPVSLSLMELFVPFCVNREGVSSLGSAKDRFAQSEEKMYRNFIKKEDMADGIRVVKGTPLYVGFPSGFNISFPEIWTWDDQDSGNERMIRMRVFEEVQLVDSVLEITCDSSAFYTAKGFAWALKFHNKTQLEFLQATNETALLMPIKVHIGQIYTKTINYHLNETYLEVERIFCFAPVQNSRKWINASRPLRVVPHIQDLFKPSRSSCQFPAINSSLQFKSHPKLVINYINYSELVILAENEMEHLFDDEQDYIRCEANYPIELIHTSGSSTPPKGSSTGGNLQYSWQRPILHEGRYTMFYNFSTLGFYLGSGNVSRFFRCQSIKNPCLHRSFQFFRVQLPGSVQSPFGKSQNLMIKSFPPGNSNQPGTVKTLMGRPPKYEECEVLFFYKETPDKQGYEFRCEFAMERRGTINYHYCDSMNGCENTLRNRRQSTKCWRKVESWGNCDSYCQREIKRADGFRSFVATCTVDQQIYAHKWRNEDGPRYRESTLGNFAVFGLPTTPDETPTIYVSQEEIDPRKMTFLEPFDPYQFPETSLNLTCSVSAFFNRPEIGHNSQIAKYFAYNNGLQLVQDDVGKRRSVLNKQGNYWSFTVTVELGKDEKLSQIQCIGLFWKGSKSSREIHIHAPEALEITLLVSDSLGERVIVERGEKSYAYQEEDKVLLPISPYNVSLVCHGFGYPPPEISWTTTAENNAWSDSVVVNITHTSSRVLLPVVNVGIEGTYICTATNQLGRVSSRMRVEIDYPLDKAYYLLGYIALSLIVILVLILALLLFVRRVRKLKRTLRNLTDEEEKRFRFGDTTVDPADNHAGILAAAYDQSLEVSPDLIEIDEKSVLGAGEFGIVRSGFLKTNANDSRALVALEFCELGNLKNFLREKKQGFTNEFLSSSLTEFEQVDFAEAYGGYDDPQVLLPESEKLETLDLLNFSFGIANGMNFLAEKKVIHGDLAARNVLLTQNREVKISDFGFSTQLKSYENYKETNPLSIPWRWFPIEALVNRKFSLKSDCWSYGILLHEIFSLGEDPYPEFDRLNLNFIQQLRDGYRMGMPEFANEDIYNLMSECWESDPHKRPKFADVCDKILNLSSEIIAPKLNLI